MSDWIKTEDGWKQSSGNVDTSEINEIKDSLTKKQDTIPSYTKDEYLAIRDTLPNGTKVCITDDYEFKDLLFETVTLGTNVTIPANGTVEYGIPGKSGYTLMMSVPMCWDGSIIATNYSINRVAFYNKNTYERTGDTLYARCIWQKNV